MKTDKSYAIFRVTGYKGRELRPYINLDFEDLLDELWELSNVFFDDYVEEDVDTFEKVLKTLEENPIEEDRYAGSDGNFVGNIYEIRDSVLIPVKSHSFTKELASHIFKNLKENND